MKNGFGLPLVLISVFIWSLWMLISGTLYGRAELSENLAPVLEGRGGTAVWPVMARYPTLAAYVELLLDTPQFLRYSGIPAGRFFQSYSAMSFLGAPAAWAFAKFHFRGKKILYTLYIVLMLMPFQVTMVSSYLVLNKLGLIDTVWAVILPGAASTLPVFIMTRFSWTYRRRSWRRRPWMGLPHFRDFYDLGFRWERRAFSRLWYWASWNTGTQ